MKKFLAALSSMRLAIGLIAYLAFGGLLATLVPQGREAELYIERYSPLLATLILRSGFSRFFSSALFILPAFLFFANLSACTVNRFLLQLRSRGKRRFGPDILHLGLILLIIGSVLSYSGRKAGFVRLSAGDAVELPDGRLLRLSDFEFLRYGDGSPKDWISRVRVERDGMAEIEEFPIQVNHPLKLGGLSIYQVSHSLERVTVLQREGGEERRIGRGEEIEWAGYRILFMASEEAAKKSVLSFTTPSGQAQIRELGQGEREGPFLVSALEDRDFTGLEAVIDPGYGLVLAALLIASFGIFLTFFQKLRGFRD